MILNICIILVIAILFHLFSSFKIPIATKPRFFIQLPLRLTLIGRETHESVQLLQAQYIVKSHSADLAHVFPNNSVEEKRLFNLVKDAYIEARYNPKFIVTKEDIDALIPKLELLSDITKRICEAKIGEYANMG